MNEKEAHKFWVSGYCFIVAEDEAEARKVLEETDPDFDVDEIERCERDDD